MLVQHKISRLRHSSFILKTQQFQFSYTNKAKLKCILSLRCEKYVFLLNYPFVVRPSRLENEPDRIIEPETEVAGYSVGTGSSRISGTKSSTDLGRLTFIKSRFELSDFTQDSTDSVNAFFGNSSFFNFSVRSTVSAASTFIVYRKTLKWQYVRLLQTRNKT